mgnify:CR=1 FL=1
MIETIKTYLSEGFGGLAKCESVCAPLTLPLVIGKGYWFYTCEMQSQAFVLSVAKEGTIHTPKRIQRELLEVSMTFGMPAVYAARWLQPHDRERLLALRQPFVVPNKMVYLPFLGLMQDTSRREIVINRTVFSSVAQLIVLGVLEHRLDNPITIQDAVERLGFSSPAIQNAFREIEHFGFAERRKRMGSRTVELAFGQTGRVLWERVRTHLVSPVRKVVGLAMPPGSDCVVAGVDALAAIGRLNEQPPTEFATALAGFSKRGYAVIGALGAPVKLQLWAYSPTRLGGNAPDVLSLVLSLADERDDRVQIEVDRILEEFKW